MTRSGRFDARADAAAAWQEAAARADAATNPHALYAWRRAIIAWRNATRAAYVAADTSAAAVDDVPRIDGQACDLGA